jgi:hypothetical protein
MTIDFCASDFFSAELLIEFFSFSHGSYSSGEKISSWSSTSCRILLMFPPPGKDQSMVMVVMSWMQIQVC